MAIAEVQLEDGRIAEVEIPDESVDKTAQSRPLLQAAKQGAKTALLGPIQATQALAKDIGKNPEQAFEKYGTAFPVLGGVAFGPAAPVGAALGETARQAIGTAIGSPSVPTSRLGIAANVIGQGVAAEPKILTAIPGVAKAGEAIASGAGGLAKSAGKTATKAISAITGLREPDIVQGFKQGYSTYLAPGMEKAQEIFRQGMEAAGISPKTPLKQVVDPQLSAARKAAILVGSKLEQGLQPTAEEALRARQAVDRIISATKMSDRTARADLFELRQAFDDALSGQSGAMERASKIYRSAVVKSNLLSPLKLTKQGTYSAVVPILGAFGASAGIVAPETRKKGLGGALALGALTSPALYGAGITSAGTVARGVNAAVQNPQARQIVSSLVSALISRKAQREQGK